MAAVCLWTREMDAELSRMRARGDTWDDIAMALGFSRFGVINRARRIGVDPAPLPVKIAAPSRADRTRVEPLPAGNAETWGAITAGTLLHGTRYPGGGV